MQSQSCDKCQRIACSILHGNTLTDCLPKGCDICIQRVKIDEEITSLQDRLYELANKRLEIPRNLNGRHDRLITRLPVELVSQILIFSTQSNYVPYFKAGRPLFWHPSILLSAVSKGWRTISLSIPQLWSSITINLGSHHLKLDITAEMLRRSRALPVFIKFKSNSTDKTNADYLNLLKIIQPHSTRWKSVDFSNSSFDNSLLQGLKGPQSLDFLRIDLEMSGLVDSFSMTSLPNKNHLVPKKLYVGYGSLADLPLRWDNLTHLEVTLINVNEILQIICHAARMTHFTQHTPLLMPSQSFPLPTEPIVNNSLQYLKITSTAMAEYSLLHYLTLPQLKIFDHTFYTTGDALETLLGFLDRSQALLDVFVFSYTVIAPTEPPNHLHWFARLPQITQLKLRLLSQLELCLWLDMFLTTLDDQSPSPIFPKLRGLEIFAPPLSRLSWFLFSCIFPYPEESIFFTSDRPLKFVKIKQVDYSAEDEEYLRKDEEDEEDEEAIEECNDDDERKNDMIMDKEAYDLLIAAQKSGVSLELIDTDGSDILAQVASFRYDEIVDMYDSSSSDESNF